MADLIVQLAVKEQLEDMNVAAEFYDALDEEVDSLLERAPRERRTMTAKLSNHAISEER